MGKKKRGTLLGDELLFRLYLSFHWRDVTETPDLALRAHALETLQAQLKSVSNGRHSIYDQFTFFDFISASIGGM
jgi:hypothetical protein